MTARPIITMDEADESLWLVDPDQPAKPVLLGYIEGSTFHGRSRSHTFAEIRALDEFLGRLEVDRMLQRARDAATVVMASEEESDEEV